MNKAELIAAIASEKNHPRDDWDYGYNAGLGAAASFAEQLDEPPAMAWQKPDREGAAYVEAMPCVMANIFADVGGWAFEYIYTHPRTGISELRWEPLLDRLVCYIPDPPPLERKTDET